MNKAITIKYDFEDAEASDLEIFNDDVQEKIDEMNQQGYKVVSVTPLCTNANDNSIVDDYKPSGSYTIGVLLIFEKI